MCVNCRSNRHLATNPRCPAKLEVDQQLQERANNLRRGNRPKQRQNERKPRGNRSRSRRRDSTQRDTLRNHSPFRVKVDEFPVLLETKNRYDLLSEEKDKRSRSRSHSRTPSRLKGGNSQRSKPSKSRSRSRSIRRQENQRRDSSRKSQKQVRKPTYAHVIMERLETGYFPDRDAEAKAWCDELRSIAEASKQARERLKQDEDDLKRLEAKIQARRKQHEEDDRIRHAREADLRQRIKAHNEKIATVQKEHYQLRRQQQRGPSPTPSNRGRQEQNETELNVTTKPTHPIAPMTTEPASTQGITMEILQQQIMLIQQTMQQIIQQQIPQLHRQLSEQMRELINASMYGASPAPPTPSDSHDGMLIQ